MCFVTARIRGSLRLLKQLNNEKTRLSYFHCNKLVAMHSIHVRQARLPSCAEARANIVRGRIVGMNVLNLPGSYEALDSLEDLKLSSVEDAHACIR